MTEAVEERPNKLAALMSSKTDNWNSPKAVLEPVRKIAPIGLDPCGGRMSLVGADTTWRGPEWEQDGLARSWAGHGLVYENPPYSQMEAWAEKTAMEAADGVEIVLLGPARTDTRWMQDYIQPAAQAICWWRGRLRFIDASTGKPALVWSKKAQRYIPASAPFPSFVAYFGHRPEVFCEAFTGKGTLIRADALVRPRAWLLAVPRVAPLSSWAKKHPRRIREAEQLFARDIHFANAGVGVEPARGPRRVTITRYGARYTNEESVEVGGELVLRALQAEKLVLPGKATTTYYQEIDRRHPRTEIQIEDVA